MNIGHLLRIERVKNGMTQKEFCDEIVTVSYYSKIERNLHSPTVDILVKLLEKNNINTFQFFQSILNNQSVNLVLSELSSLFYKNDVDKIKKIFNQVNISSEYTDIDKQLIESLTKLLNATLSHNIPNLEPEIKEILQTQLFDLSTWDLHKLSLYSQIIELYDIDSSLIMINSILKKDIDLYSFQEKTFIMVILLNFVIICFKNNQDNLALKYSEIINNESANPENFFLKMINQFFYLLILKKKGKKVEENQFENIFNVLKMSGMEVYVNNLYSLYTSLH